MTLVDTTTGEVATFKAHPYADAWPMLANEELAELAEDIATNGLRDSIVMRQDKILDGRNRFAACTMAGVEPHFSEFPGSDDDALAFVQSINNARRHQSKGSRAASWALSMLAAGKRQEGRWQYGESRNSEIRDDVRAQLGVVADHCPELLVEIRDGDLTLNAAFERARSRKEAAESVEAKAAREAESEAQAKAFIDAKDADLAAKVGGDTIATYREAVAIWEQRNAEEVRLRKQRERDLNDSIDRDRDRIVAFLNGWPTAAKLADHPHRTKVLDRLAPHYRQTFLQIESEGFTWTSTN